MSRLAVSWNGMVNMPSGSFSPCIRREFPAFLYGRSHANLFYRFGIELAPEVVQADGNVRNLAWRVCNAKRVLVCNLGHISIRDWWLIYNRLPIACRDQTVPQLLSRKKNKTPAFWTTPNDHFLDNTLFNSRTSSCVLPRRLRVKWKLRQQPKYTIFLISTGSGNRFSIAFRNSSSLHVFCFYSKFPPAMLPYVFLFSDSARARRKWRKKRRPIRERDQKVQTMKRKTTMIVDERWALRGNRLIHQDFWIGLEGWFCVLLYIVHEDTWLNLNNIPFTFGIYQSSYG